MAEPNKPNDNQDNVGMGYPKIEQLIEHEKFETINKSFADAYSKLEVIMQDRSAGLKKQKGAQKAMKTYELTTALLNELLQIKYQIVKLRKEQETQPKNK